MFLIVNDSLLKVAEIVFCFQFLLGFSVVFEALHCLSALSREFDDSILFCSCENVEVWEMKSLGPVKSVLDKYLLYCTKSGLI